jgi:16S rRNA (uracil1498-N3)-methyltransferase
MHRFFVAEENLHGKEIVFTGRQAHQIRNVLRIKSGDHVTVLDNTGCEYTVILTKVGRQDVVGEVVSRQQARAEPHTQITLYQSLLARDKFEWVLQKCTEVGVTSFVPIVTERSIVRQPDAITSRKLSRWRDIIAEAAEQSGRGRIPQLDAPVTFVDAVCRLEDFDRCLIGTLGTTGSSVRDILRTDDAEPAAVALFIGPEGGFTDKEVQLAETNGIKPVSLGSRILRTETAAVVASAVILYELGDLAP